MTSLSPDVRDALADVAQKLSEMADAADTSPKDPQDAVGSAEAQQGQAAPSNRNSSKEDAVEAVRKICGGVDYSLDTSGKPTVLRQAIDALGIRGTCGIVGAPSLGTEGSFDINSLMIPGRSIRGICEGDSLAAVFIPQLIELHRQGRFRYLDRRLRALVSERGHVASPGRR